MGDVNVCHECLPKFLKKKKKMADADDVCSSELRQERDDEEEEEEVQSILNSGSRKRAASWSDAAATTVFKTKKGKIGKSLTVFSEESVNGVSNEDARARVTQIIARFFYMNGIALNLVESDSFSDMVCAIGNYGPGLEIPSYHEMRVPLLKNELKETKEWVKGHEEDWPKFGCTIMVDACTDKKNRTLMNLRLNCRSETVFVKSVDASPYMETGDKLFELLDSFVEEIGEKNVVQVITDHSDKYELAGKLLQAKRSNLYWTPNAPCCVDLMLQDIGRIPRVKRTIQRGITLVGFIYSNSSSLNMLMKFTKKIELVRQGVTRFATTVLTLQRLYKQKSNLKKMFTSYEWLSSNRFKDDKGKRATNIVLMPRFWKDVVYSLKVMGPVAHALRVVCNEKNPGMGHIYQVMNRAKEAIQQSFNGNEDEYWDIFAIIDKRWECQLHHPLHAAGYFLNPEFFYGNPQIKCDAEVLEELFECMERLIPTDKEFGNLANELASYMSGEGIFGSKEAKSRLGFDPSSWWESYGSSTPNLQAFAIKVLNLTCHAYGCDAFGCERNWNIFENIHFKKRSKLEQQKLEDLVFIKCNQDLKERFHYYDIPDPLLLNDIDYSNEWLVGEMSEDGETNKEELVFNDDTFTWGAVPHVVGVGKPETLTKWQARLKNKETSRPSSSRARDIIADAEEEVTYDVESEEEEQEEEEEEAAINKYIYEEMYKDDESSEEQGDNGFY